MPRVPNLTTELLRSFVTGLGVTARTEHALIAGIAVMAPESPLPPIDVVLRHARRTPIGDLLEALFVETPPTAA